MIGADESNGLEKHCFAPMTYQDEQPKLSQCVVQSILGYIQNKENNLVTNGSFHYLTHLEGCIRYDPLKSFREYLKKFCILNLMNCTCRNPYDMKCMGPYGGPVEPGIALGGYKPGDDGKIDYKTSTGLILTFLLNNSQDLDALKPTMDWELK